jgi:hypothetical protein
MQNTEKMEPKTIKFKPYVGLSDENNAKGKLTKVILKDDRMEYDVNYTQKVNISMSDDLGGEKIKESFRYVEEFGVVDKHTISNVIKYIKTEYTEEGEPSKVFVVDILNAAVQLTFEIESEDDRNKLFDELMIWKYGK